MKDMGKPQGTKLKQDQMKGGAFYSGRSPRSMKLPSGPLRLYYQVANLIRGGILEGTWPSGARLPSEQDLATKYGVSRPTVRHAKAVLAEEGFIRSIKGSGCYVNGHEMWKAQPPTVGNLNDIFHFGSKMSFKVLAFGLVPNSEEIKAKLGNPEDRYVFQIKGVRWYQGKPISCSVYYLPFKFG